jgi:hypothetical protein
MMPPMRKSPLCLVRLSLAWGMFLSGCASTPLVLTIPPRAEAVGPPAYGSKDYSGALAAIVSAMVRDLKLPAIEASVTLYFSQTSYESGVVAESEKDLQRLRQQLGPHANRLREEELVFSARRFAVSSVAVGMYKKVLVNEWRLAKYPWPEWVKVLAHELTHTVERNLVEGRLTVSDQWLREGFAEWVGYQVADTFGAETFAKSRDRVLDSIATAKSYQTFPSLTQLARNAEWLTWSKTLGRAATYGQALIAVDLLVEQKGLAAVVEYFRLFGELNNRERNFTTAFGEPISGFEGKFTKHLHRLLEKRSRSGLFG